MTVKMKDKILFSSGSATIGKEGLDALRLVADALKHVQGKVIRVEGHTDSVPATGSTFASNWELSSARALAVVRYLQEQGVDPTKLSGAGYGEFQPIGENETPEGRSLNRRIEIVLADAEGMAPPSITAEEAAAPDVAAAPARRSRRSRRRSGEEEGSPLPPGERDGVRAPRLSLTLPLPGRGEGPPTTSCSGPR